MELKFTGKTGGSVTKTEYTSTTPRKWTKEEEDWALEKDSEGVPRKDIAKALNRSETSVSIKLKRLKKRTEHNTYNEAHVENKYTINKMFQEYLSDNSKVLDLFCGVNSYWKNTDKYKVVSNDLDKNIPADYNMDAFKLLCKLYYEGEKFDMIDLDPFGSAYECFDLAIKMSRKAIIITYGEMGHKRWKRTDYVSKRYGIHTLEDFTLDKMIEKTQEIGRRNKKELTPVYTENYKNISRVYYTISTYKETSQWQDKK